jgi:hypothetical protein
MRNSTYPRGGDNIHVSLRGVLTQKRGVIFMYLSGVFSHRKRGYYSCISHGRSHTEGGNNIHVSLSSIFTQEEGVIFI